MATELAFALINPYSIAKSRTGGIMGRFISRTGLELVAARMFGPSQELVETYASQLRQHLHHDERTRNILADYVLKSYAPDPATGRRRRVMMLLFEGENAIEKIYRVAGPLRPNMEAGETVRDTYGDFIMSESGDVRYVEPAVLVAPDAEAARNTLTLWSRYSESDGGLIQSASDVEMQDVEQTLVLIKPDNFRFPSSRPGNIIDLFSRSGLRIVAAKVHRMSVAEALKFYEPVREILRSKLKGTVAARAEKALAQELGIEIPEEVRQRLGEELGPRYGERQFAEIVHFMTGRWPVETQETARTVPGSERCLALVYAGLDAVNKIRSILGSTDPSLAEPGSVRREFGRDIMVNAAHASDSAENARREMNIINMKFDSVREWISRYYGP
ncbi:MAG: nucleoside-diphosphate kinase [Kiritimatiellae bacterium]|nr:nucleoside-diphosphate kinase [Kiritimatiellia bacterium]